MKDLKTEKMFAKLYCLVGLSKQRGGQFSSNIHSIQLFSLQMVLIQGPTLINDSNYLLDYW